MNLCISYDNKSIILDDGEIISEFDIDDQSWKNLVPEDKLDEILFALEEYGFISFREEA